MNENVVAQIKTMMVTHSDLKKTASHSFDLRQIQSFKDVWCTIEKHTDNQKRPVERYLIHKNTLGQMLYEVFTVNHQDFKSFFLPIIILLDPVTVGGICIPGYYYFDDEQEKFLYIREVEPEVIDLLNELRGKYQINSNLSLGYLYNHTTPSASVDVDDRLNRLMKGTQDFSELLSIHGGLKDICVLASQTEDMIQNRFSDTFLAPIFLTQWIEKA
ncbi:hypothetical protein [Brevibacillus dissolubilis]|uniref:hypothetical protein n=1 Tax=Brevibacillus dissolubilis TaxID=1844116 RepID=UPI00111755D9|nr:hypothetical protein [Brevibacillus dissolubilis]